MSTLPAHIHTRPRVLEFLALPLGFLVLYLPTFWDAAHSIWNAEDQAHGPLILAVCAWSFWDRREQFRRSIGAGAGTLAWTLLLLGLALYALGRAQRVRVMELGSMIPVLAGGIAVLYGWPALRAVRFGVLFLVFAVPLPSAVLDELTAPLKQGVSAVAESMLYALDYPVARNGVVISLGQYKLLIADACSGLYSMTSLFALAVAYVHVLHDSRTVRNVTLLLASLPIAFFANVMRVVVLALVTYYWGDAAGQGFLHGTAGLVMFVSALVLIFALDAAFQRYGARAPSPR